jgi:hypothetical protein
MEMVIGLDLHRSQITFRTVDLRTGEVQRGKIYPGAERQYGNGWIGSSQAPTPTLRSRVRPAGASWWRRSSAGTSPLTSRIPPS